MGAVIGTAIAGPVGTAVGAIAGAIVGGFAEATYNMTSRVGLGEDALAAADKTLNTLTDKMIEGMNKAFEKITDDFVGNLADTTPHLTAIAALTQSLDMPDADFATTVGDFEALRDVLESSGEKGKAFAQFLDQKLLVGVMESLKSADDDTKKLFASATARGYDITNIESLRNAAAELGEASGQTSMQVHMAINTMRELNQQQM